MKKLIYIISVVLLCSCTGKNDPAPVTNEKDDFDKIVILDGMNLYGQIKDNDGNPVAGVVVSDGYSCTQTDEKGVYQMKRNNEAGMVYFSTPSEYEINTTSAENKYPLFYTSIDKKTTTAIRKNFRLSKLSKVENDFTLFVLADPQVTNTDEIERFKAETMPDMLASIRASNLPAYGINMGDVVGDQPSLMPTMKLQLGKLEIPFFTTVGNHDKVKTSANSPRSSDTFIASYGPLNYSFNRGKVHFVCLDNVVFTNAEDYAAGFSDEQIEWLRQDLSYVSKDKMIILYYHIPIRAASVKNKQQLFNLLNGYAEVHLMCGHTHYNENYIHTSPLETYEHVHGAACGAWWRSVINADGTPNGYAVYDVRGNTMANWYYKSVNFDKNYQIRLHHGDASFGGEYGIFNYSQAGNTILANIWNADESWKIEVYENGVKTGNMTPLSKSLKDAWALGYHIGVLNRNPDNYSAPSKHLYIYAPNNMNASITVKATDRFGNVYEQGAIITDFRTAKSY